VIQVITNNATNCKGVGKIIERVRPRIFWIEWLVHTMNILIHYIVKHKECGWISYLYKIGKKLVNHHRVYKGPIPVWHFLHPQAPLEGEIGFG
jgi:hypothetical protein